MEACSRRSRRCWYGSHAVFISACLMCRAMLYTEWHLGWVGRACVMALPREVHARQGLAGLQPTLVSLCLDKQRRPATRSCAFRMGITMRSALAAAQSSVTQAGFRFVQRQMCDTDFVCDCAASSSSRLCSTLSRPIVDDLSTTRCLAGVQERPAGNCLLSSDGLEALM